MFWTGNRREFMATTAATLAGGTLISSVAAQAPLGERPQQAPEVRILNPRARVPLSFIIDDSTCLVNMGHFCMPQFAAVYPQRVDYQKPWRKWPREIPDQFVRRFGEWCASAGVKGKYSIVPYPACVGWVDREIPGWSRQELLSSLQLVRDLMVPNWDIHPEMITHTRVIDLKSGRPIEEISPATMENSYPQSEKSVDELTAYLAYALRILNNCGLPCEGVTTPGGFGNRVKPQLSQAVQQAVRDVTAAEIPHFFKYVVGPEESTEPRVEHVSGLGTSNLNLTVNVVAGTGDWFGGWDGDLVPEPDRYANADASQGRMVEMIEKGEPAIMLCHWPGMYCQGSEAGFQAFQRVVTALNTKYHDRTQWMKLSEIARYWAVKELARSEISEAGILFDSPFACPDFTFQVPHSLREVRIDTGAALRHVHQRSELVAGTCVVEQAATTICLTLRAGENQLSWTTTTN